MKLIDLFSRMVTNKELPEKIKFKNKIWTLDYPCFTYRDENDECIEKRFILENLTEEVEIIEEHKIPEKLTNTTLYGVPILNKKELSNIALTNKRDISDIKDAVNKIIDKLEEIE